MIRRGEVYEVYEVYDEYRCDMWELCEICAQQCNWYEYGPGMRGRLNLCWNLKCRAFNVYEQGGRQCTMQPGTRRIDKGSTKRKNDGSEQWRSMLHLKGPKATNLYNRWKTTDLLNISKRGSGLSGFHAHRKTYRCCNKREEFVRWVCNKVKHMTDYNHERKKTCHIILWFCFVPRRLMLPIQENKLLNPRQHRGVHIGPPNTPAS